MELLVFTNDISNGWFFNQPFLFICSMKMLDFIIVGNGLAALAFAEVLLQNNCSFVVFGDSKLKSSRVAAGLYNPLIVKRYRPLQDAVDQIDFLRSFYSRAEQRLCAKFHHEKLTLRKFVSIAEQNDWFEHADKPQLANLLSNDLFTSAIEGIDSPFQYGVVNYTGHLDTNVFITKYQTFLADSGCFIAESFIYADLEFSSEFVTYHEFQASNVIFAEGYGVNQNPYFNFVSVPGTKGEGITIHAPQLKLTEIINSGVFILPLGNDLFKVGATYEWTDKTEQTTAAAREELTMRLKQVIQCDFEIVDQWAGVRPTTPDRKAIVGNHPQFPQLHILNGLGTRGVMLGPTMAKLLYDHIVDKKEIPTYLQAKRFWKQ
ncbi:NAD(P)/FAD-dependent oxidoreductase [Flavobacterium sp.]|uniref:NAD(P)/FAD-dependent oxidoreductase n=1 Tax=Flavobacterium sp. TaxID=239 RepID=UPI003B9A7120